MRSPACGEEGTLPGVVGGELFLQEASYESLLAFQEIWNVHFIHVHLDTDSFLKIVYF